MLEETLVVWGAEFGRTPTAENGDGRGHHPKAFTVWMAGGGVRNGLTYGSTDDFGYAPVENPVHMHDFHATLLHVLGMDHERLTYRYAGRDFRLTDVYGQSCKRHLGVEPSPHSSKHLGHSGGEYREATLLRSLSLTPSNVHKQSIRASIACERWVAAGKKLGRSLTLPTRVFIGQTGGKDVLRA